MAIELPQSGWKASGVGLRHGGAEGIRKYTRKQSLFVTGRVPSRDLHHFPYSRRRTRIVKRLIALFYGGLTR
jgi:betaine-aldehyde dehydrogenase